MSQNACLSVLIDTLKKHKVTNSCHVQVSEIQGQSLNFNENKNIETVSVFTIDFWLM